MKTITIITLLSCFITIAHAETCQYYKSLQTMYQQQLTVNDMQYYEMHNISRDAYYYTRVQFLALEQKNVNILKQQCNINVKVDN